MAIDLLKFYAQLYIYITDDVGINEIIVKRRYNTRLPQNVLFPALTFQLVNLSDTKIKSAASDYDIVRIQFNCYGRKLATAEKLAQRVRNKFDRFNEESQDVKFHQTFFIDRNAPVFDETQKIYWIALDFDFHIK